MVFRSGVAAAAALMLAFVGFDATGAAASKTAAPTGCALVPIALLENTFGEKFDDPPLETPAAPAYDGPEGKSCQFFSKPPFALGHQTRVDFVVYQESSAKVARDTFDKVKVYLADNSKGTPSIGDEAYWWVTDDESSLLVLKGNTHFSLGIQPKNEAQVMGLAATIAKEF
ncbi:MAG TPA: hypothetical protein VN607_10735 [Gemmatimonadaceae bacterium]|nr:hypothetical protein [Gemmatimonadaceae bacterium]